MIGVILFICVCAAIVVFNLAMLVAMIFDDH